METKQKTQAVAKTEATPSALLELAVQQNLDIDKLEKLMAMQERWQAGQARKAFLDAMSEFQAKCPILTKNKKVGYKTKAGGTVGYSYVPLGEIARQIKELLQQVGLSYRWETEDKGEQIIITCVVSHRDGHFERNTMSGAKDDSGNKNAIQQRGSTITYLQRYTLIGALGISSADADVDGQLPKPKTELPELGPGHPKWEGAIEALIKKTVKLPQIKKKFYISKENEELLTKEQVIHETNTNT